MMAVAALASPFAAHPARAESARAEPGAVVVVGGAASRDRATVAAAVRSAARSAAWELVETPLAESDAAAVVACMRSRAAWSCVAPIAASRGLARVIVVRVEPDRAPDGAAALALTEQIVLSGTGAPTADERYCARCTDETLTRVAFDLTQSLLQEASAGTARTKLTVRSTPPGAWITLDTVNVGLTDHTYATFPGRHVVIVQRAGYATETRRVDVAENGDTLVAVELHAEAAADASFTAAHPYVVPGAVGGIGVAVVVAGIALQASAGPPTNGAQPHELVSGPGIALMAGGALAIAAGVYLFARAGRRAPVAAPIAGGAVVGWAGVF